MMNDPSLISIVLTTFNRASWLPKSIGSVLAQTHKNWEMILWDDGSSDNTREVVQSFKDDRIRYYYDDNHGMSFALNQAIRLCHGNYIAFIDDDDQWLEQKLAVQFDAISKYPEIGVLFTNFYNVNIENKEEGIGFEQCQVGLKNIETLRWGSGLYQITKGMPESLLRSNFILPSTTLVRRSLFDDFGGFNEQLRNAMDFELWWRFGLAGVKFALIDEILVRRYKPQGSLSSPSIKTYENKISALNLCVNQAKSKKREDLINLFKPSYLSAWQGLIRLYALLGDRRKALGAFNKSLIFGLSWRSIYLLLGALFGPRLVN